MSRVRKGSSAVLDICVRYAVIDGAKIDREVLIYIDTDTTKRSILDCYLGKIILRSPSLMCDSIIGFRRA